MLGSLFPIGGLIAGIITVGAGVIILVWPKIIAYIIGIYLTRRSTSFLTPLISMLQIQIYINPTNYFVMQSFIYCKVEMICGNLK